MRKGLFNAIKAAADRTGATRVTPTACGTYVNVEWATDKGGQTAIISCADSNTPDDSLVVRTQLGIIVCLPSHLPSVLRAMLEALSEAPEPEAESLLRSGLRHIEALTEPLCHLPGDRLRQWMRTVERYLMEKGKKR